VWQGRRILPEGWMAQALRPTPQSDGVYGAHFWRKVPGFLRPGDAPERPLPEDRFYMLGHEGQMVAVVPSRELVVVRLGLSRKRDAWDPDALLADALDALPKAP
jgi:CubicO group peptidase (beta-lactamase class C family)